MYIQIRIYLYIYIYISVVSFTSPISSISFMSLKVFMSIKAFPAATRRSWIYAAASGALGAVDLRVDFWKAAGGFLYII